jgi:sulfate adenylyltransferase
VIDSLLESGERTVTSLDGDVVRRHLSAGLTFSREDRETNIRRIGWVAAEISRHGGVAVCSPIAPFDATRQDVRAMTTPPAVRSSWCTSPPRSRSASGVTGRGSTPRPGAARSRSSPASPRRTRSPTDADLRMDTTGRSIEDCRDEVLQALAKQGYISSEGTDEHPDVHDDSAPIRVLFVCTANICRSPYLELRARQLLGPDSGVEVSSAGIRGFDADPVSDTMAAEFARHGTDTSTFRSRPATADLVDRADLVLTAEADHRTRLLEDRPAAFHKIFTLGQFVASARAADPDLRGRDLIEALEQRRVPESPDHDIPDPYRRGPRRRVRPRSPWRACWTCSSIGCVGSPRSGIRPSRCHE